VACP
jgi:phosphoenolpyruvate carboxylase